MERDLQVIQIEDIRRVLIIGNGGSGKTWLASKIGLRPRASIIHLDDVRWQSGQYGIRRDDELVLRDVVAAGAVDSWIIEGVYGWLAKSVLDRATTLIWLDLPEADCIANIRARGIQGGGSTESFQELIEWVGEYRQRENSSSSFRGHQELFDTYNGQKARLRTRGQINMFASNVDKLMARNRGYSAQ